MSIAKHSGMPNSYRYSTVCLDSYEERELQGRLYHSSQEHGLEFHSTIEFLQLVEMICDSISYPKASVDRRAFLREGKGKMLLAYDRGRGGGIEFGRQCTLILKVESRKYASWQGEVQWVARGERRRFASTKELLQMLDQELAGVEWGAEKIPGSPEEEESEAVLDERL